MSKKKFILSEKSWYKNQDDFEFIFVLMTFFILHSEMTDVSDPYESVPIIITVIAKPKWMG